MTGNNCKNSTEKSDDVMISQIRSLGSTERECGVVCFGVAVS